MLLTKSNLDYAYSEYKKQYDKTKAYITKQGGQILQIGMMSRSEFEIDFRSVVAEDPVKAQKKGWKAISQGFAKQDLYPVSWKQAERFARAHAKQFGEPYSINLALKYRMRRENRILDAIQIRRAELKSDKYEPGAIRTKVSQEFFDSEV